MNKQNTQTNRMKQNLKTKSIPALYTVKTAKLKEPSRDRHVALNHRNLRTLEVVYIVILKECRVIFYFYATKQSNNNQSELRTKYFNQI